MYFLIGLLIMYRSITSMARSYVSSLKNFARGFCSKPYKPSPCKYWRSSGFALSGKTDTKVAFREWLTSAFTFSFANYSFTTILAKYTKWSLIPFYLWDYAQISCERKVLSTFLIGILFGECRYVVQLAW